MAILSEIPTLYRTRWDSSTAFTPPESGSFEPNLSNAPDTTPRKLNSSCVHCRKSRVKCSGGNPCDRCAVSSHPLDCEYSVSRRWGKRKASDNVPRPTEPTQTNARGPGHVPNFGFEILGSVSFGPNVHDEPHVWDGVGLSGPDFGSLGSVMEAANHVSFPSFTDFLNNMGSPLLPPGPIREDKGTCPNECFVLVHAVTNKFASASNATALARFDKVMSLLDESVKHAAKYLACLTCDAGCSRLMMLSLLHQRQVDGLTDLAKTRDLSFPDESQRVLFGSFVSSAEDDVNCKRVVLLRIARDIGQSLNSFHDGAKDFEEQYIKGTLELGDAGKLNLNWLLGVAVILKKRVDCVRLLLQKPDWAVHTYVT